MRPDEYQEFNRRLREGLERDPDVVGLVALGSMSGEGAAADEWSDHDFFVVTRPGAQERFRTDLSWLPEPGEVAHRFRETAHGVQVLLRSGHLLELAVFDLDELRLARVNRLRVLLDRGGVAERMAEVRRATEAGNRPDPAHAAGQLLGRLQVGVGRWRRGERLAGEQVVRCQALGYLLRLLAHAVPPADPAAPDDLDPFRRFERGWPRLAAELEALRALPVPEAAAAMLALAEREVPPELLPPAGVAAVRRAIGPR
jgi:hypothetical protein